MLYLYFYNIIIFIWLIYSWIIAKISRIGLKILIENSTLKPESNQGYPERIQVPVGYYRNRKTRKKSSWFRSKRKKPLSNIGFGLSPISQSCWIRTKKLREPRNQQRSCSRSSVFSTLVTASYTRYYKALNTVFFHND